MLHLGPPTLHSGRCEGEARPPIYCCLFPMTSFHCDAQEDAKEDCSGLKESGLWVTCAPPLREECIITTALQK